MEEAKTIETLKELISWRGKSVEIRDYEIDAIKDLLNLYYKEKARADKLEKDYSKALTKIDELEVRIDEYAYGEDL